MSIDDPPDVCIKNYIKASPTGTAIVVVWNQAGTSQHAIDARAHIGCVVRLGATQHRFGMRLKIEVIEIRISIGQQLR